MDKRVVRLSVPPEATFARSVRMMAANLAVLCSMSVDEVEDARMVAEEAFVFSCATRPDLCEIDFFVTDEALSMEICLGASMPPQDSTDAGHIELAQLLLEAVSDSCEIVGDGSVLRVTKLVGGVHDAN
jgi:serine/threonine-protein kinase RsbW